MFGTYQRLRLSVSASNVTVIKTFSRKMIKPSHRFSAEAKAGRKRAYRTMLDYHANARKLAKAVARGFY